MMKEINYTNLQLHYQKHRVAPYQTTKPMPYGLYGISATG